MILVIGGTGFLGSALVRELVKQGKKVRVLSRSGKNFDGVEVARGDITDIGSVREAVKGCGLVFHLAANMSYFVPEQELDIVNVDGSRNVMDACVGEGVKRVVFASSVAVDNHTRYGRSKKRSEDLVMSYSGKLEVVSLRFAAIYGPNSPQMKKLLGAAKKGQAGMIGKDYQTHLVSLDNSISALLRGMVGKPGIWNIADPEQISADRMYEIVADGLGVRKKRIPKAAVFLAALALEIVWRVTGKKVPLNLDYYKTLTIPRDYDIGPAIREFGYDPKVKTEDGLRELVDWYVKNIGG